MDSRHVGDGHLEQSVGGAKGGPSPSWESSAQTGVSPPMPYPSETGGSSEGGLVSHGHVDYPQWVGGEQGYDHGGSQSGPQGNDPSGYASQGFEGFDPQGNPQSYSQAQGFEGYGHEQNPQAHWQGQQEGYPQEGYTQEGYPQESTAPQWQGENNGSWQPPGSSLPEAGVSRESPGDNAPQPGFGLPDASSGASSDQHPSYPPVPSAGGQFYEAGHPRPSLFNPSLQGDGAAAARPDFAAPQPPPYFPSGPAGPTASGFQPDGGYAGNGAEGQDYGGYDGGQYTEGQEFAPQVSLSLCSEHGFEPR